MGNQVVSKSENTDLIPSLQHVGIKDWTQLFYNLSYDEFLQHETAPSLQGYDRGYITTTGAVAVDTGKFTGRSPQDKYIVEESTSKNNVWWSTDPCSGSNNKPLSEEAWKHLKEISTKQLNGKKLYVSDGFCGANPENRLSVRLVTEVACMAHFFKNIFIRPTEQELKNFKPDWTILNACKTTCQDFAKYNMRSEVFV